MAPCINCILYIYCISLLCLRVLKSDTHKEYWRILGEERAPSSVKDGDRY